MSCYGVDTPSIERLDGLMRDVPDAIREFDGSPNQAGMIADYEDLLREIVVQFFGAFDEFLQVMASLMQHRIALKRNGLAGNGEEEAIRRTAFLVEFLEIYAAARGDGLTRLRDILNRVFEADPSLRAIFVSELAASYTAREMAVFTATVAIAETEVEADEQGEAGKQVTDSVKGFIRNNLESIPVLGGIKSYKRKVENTLHVLNEILGMVFRGSA